MDWETDATETLMEEMGFDKGSWVINKETKEIAQIIGMEQGIVELREKGALQEDTTTSIMLEDFQAKKWSSYEPELDPVEIKQWHDHCPLKNSDWVNKTAQGQIFLALDELWREHSKNYGEKLTLFKEPRKMVQVKENIACWKLVLVPATMSLAWKDDPSKIPESAYQIPKFAGAKCFYYLNSCYIETGGKKDAFLNPFWFIESTPEEQNANIKLYSLDACEVQIPVYKNFKALVKGDSLKYYKPPKNEGNASKASKKGK